LAFRNQHLSFLGVELNAKSQGPKAAFMLPFIRLRINGEKDNTLSKLMEHSRPRLWGGVKRGATW
jgi:hypothetical protein